MSRIIKHREHKKSTKALRKALDKTKGFVYNLLQTLLAFLVAIQAKPKGVLHKMFARISRGVPAISSIFHNLRKEANMATLIRRAFGATLLSALAIALVACGGGGSSTPTTPSPPAKTPIAGKATATASPAQGDTGVAVDAELSITVDVTAGTYASSTGTLACGGPNITLTAGQPSSLTGKVKIVFTKTGALPFSDPTATSANCQFNTAWTVAGVDGGAQANGTTQSAFKTVSWWPPKTISAIGVKGVGIQELPLDSLGSTPAVAGDVWKQKTVDGTLKYAETGMVLTGINTRPLYIAVFISPTSKGYCIAPVYRDDGNGVFPNPHVYGMCYSTPFDALWGVIDGVIVRFPSLSNNCYKVVYDQNLTAMKEQAGAVPCPN